MITFLGFGLLASALLGLWLAFSAKLDAQTGRKVIESVPEDTQ